MSKYSDAAAQVSAAAAGDDAKVTKNCAAYGCPRAGSINPSTRGEGTWWCAEHFTAVLAGTDLQEVTRLIRSGKLPVRDPRVPTSWCERNRHLVRRKASDVEADAG